MGILNWFFPKDEKFFDLLKKQSDAGHEATKTFKSLVTNYDRLSYAKKIQLLKQITKIEQQGDKQIKETVSQLNHTFITPIDREDIHELANLLDDIIDDTEKIGKMFIEYNITELDKSIAELTKIIFEGSLEITAAINKLRKLKNVGSNALHHLEQKADVIKRQAISTLFKNSTNPMNVIKYKDIYEELEIITDLNCKIGVLIEGIVVKHV